MQTYLYIGLVRIDEAIDFYLNAGFKLLHSIPSSDTAEYKKYFYKTEDKYGYALIGYENCIISISHVTQDCKNHGGITICFNLEEKNKIKMLIEKLEKDSTDSVHNFDKWLAGEHYCFYDKFGVAWIFALVN